MTIQWACKAATSYEVSSRGDQRFSALYAQLSDGRTIEQWYQCDIKGYQPKGRDWKLGKGKPPLYSYAGETQYELYLGLWRLWTLQNLNMVQELKSLVAANGNTLTDMFANTPINQARALAQILNEWFA